MRHPNVLLVVLDTVRADHCGAFGYERPTTPFLCRLAESSIAYDDAITNAPWTLPAHASLFTGLLSSVHGCQEGNPYLDRAMPSLPEAFRRQGYFTAAVSCNTWISPAFGFGRGFDLFIKPWQLRQKDDDISRQARLRQLRARAVLDFIRRDPLSNLANGLYGRFLWRIRDKGAGRANAFLRRLLPRLPQPFFLFVNYLEAHLPYRPPSGWGRLWLHEDDRRRRHRLSQDPWTYVTKRRDMTAAEADLLVKLYDAEVEYVDACLGHLWGLLAARGLADGALTLVTSDHGENLGEHHLMDHQFSVHQSLLEVPLVLRLPGGEGGGVRPGAPVDLTQVAPTLLSAAGLASGNDFPSATLLEAPSDRPRIAEYESPGGFLRRLGEICPGVDLDPLDRSLRAVIRDGLKLVEDSRGVCQLFDLKADPREERDLAGDRPAEAGFLRDLAYRVAGPFESRLGVARDPDSEADLDPRIRQRLRDTGYLE